MTMELRQWAIEKAIAAGTDCCAVTKIAEDFLEFVMNEPADHNIACGRPTLAQVEAAFDAGEKPRHAAKRLGTIPSRISGYYSRIRETRKNGTAHS